MRIYLNKAGFKPVLIICSAFFVPIIIILFFVAINDKKISMWMVFLFFLVLYFVFVIPAYIESTSNKNYMDIKENSIIIKHPSISDDMTSKEIPINNISSFEYFRMNSIISWIAIICLVIPNTLIINIDKDGKSIDYNIGFCTKNDIIKICNENNIKLILH